MTAVPDAGLRVVRLATSGVTPEQLQRVVSGLLDEGARATPRQVLEALEARLRRGGRLAGMRAAEGALDRLQGGGARVLVAGEQGYPQRLAELWPQLGAPLWLFVRIGMSPPGELGVPGVPEVAGAAEVPGAAVAVVGTRTPSLDGLRTAGELAALCAELGVAVVSGMARGIDQAAHAAALAAGGVTMAVLGTGFGVDYPRGATALREGVERSGGLLTELLPGAPPRPVGFLHRNRIISGLADVCVVVEGRTRSGALHTAGLAAAQGREVCAVPGSPNQPTAQAPLALIRDGARCLTRVEDLRDVLTELPASRVPAAHAPAGAAAGASPLRPRTHPLLTGSAAAVHALIGPTPATAGEVADALDRPLPEALAALAELEERGFVRGTPRGYVRAPAAPAGR